MSELLFHLRNIKHLIALHKTNLLKYFNEHSPKGNFLFRSKHIQQYLKIRPKLIVNLHHLISKYNCEESALYISIPILDQFLVKYL